MSSTCQTIERRLDDLERRLPALAATSLRMQRLIGARLLSVASEVGQAWQNSARAASQASSTSVKTVAGTARDAGEETVNAASTAVRRVTGQAEAEGRQMTDAVTTEAGEAVDSAKEAADELRRTAVEAVDAVAKAVDPDRTPTGESFEELTKAELYRRAASLEIAGRSKMSKQQLIDALDEQ